MDSGLTNFIKATVAIFAVVDALGLVPTVLAMVEPYSLPRRRQIVTLAVLVALAVIVAMGVGGGYLLSALGISFQAMMFGGGLLLVVVGIRNIVTGSHGGSAEVKGEEGWMELAVSPLAMPLLAGPGAIVTVMLMANTYGPLLAVGASMVAFAASWLILHYAQLAARLLGRIGTLALGRVMQIIIVALGMSYCFRALGEVFPALLK